MRNIKNIIFIITLASLFLGIGYATVNNVTLTISGTSLSAENGDVKITNVTRLQAVNVTAPVPVYGTHWTDTNISLQISTNVNSSSAVDRYAIYEITVTNDSVQNLVLSADLFDPQITPSKQSLKYAFDVIGVKYGDEVRAKSSITFQIKITLLPSEQGSQTLGINAVVQLEESQEGYLMATFKDNATHGDLTGDNTITKFTISAMNSYQRVIEFNLSSSNDQSFEFVNNDGTPLSNFQIPGLTESQDFDFYLKIKDGSEFVKSPQLLNVYLNPVDGERISIGMVTIDVPYNELIIDNEPPTITSLNVSKANSERKISIVGEATDNMGIDHFDIFAYKSGQSSPVQSKLGLADLSCEFENLSDGTYTFKVIAYDGKDNSSERSTAATNYTWTYTVSVSCDSNCTASPTSQNVEAGGTATVTLSGKSGYNNNQPDIASATMIDSTTNQTKNLTRGTDYTYTNGSFVISNVIGNVSVSAEGVRNCLAEGTKILLANGKTKNIEDIKYDDLLAVWNYDTGTITYEYPLWIEKPGKATEYIKIIFDDNTELKIVHDHALYNTDTNLFINYSDNEIKVGTNVAKVDNGKIKSVKITGVEIVEETVNYYFVGSTRYYNVIANDVLTTDRYKIISNLYGFMDNAKWPEKEEKLTKNNSNIIGYEYFKDFLPYYLYKGFRVSEAGYLFNNNQTTANDFKNYIIEYITDDDDLIKPIMKNNSNYWMVTTSLDNVNDNNKSKYLLREGSFYILPYTVNLWYSTSENKYYKPGEMVIVNHGMHFVAIN